MSAAAARAQAVLPALPKLEARATPRVQRRSQRPVHVPPARSLAAVPARPTVATVQRKCADCEGEAELPVQPQLEVGPVGDRYEQEADTIAASVMAMRESDVSPGEATVARQLVQRACSACSRDDDKPRLRRRLDDAIADELKVRAKPAGSAVGESISASDGQLTRGGSPLPRATRAFFEGRMGRDLAGVRVHTSGEASALNASIAARAFTYKNHVWLGAGERGGPSFTLAHELAHVMQQTAPGPLGPAASAPPRVMRVPCDPRREDLFFAPKPGAVTDAPKTRKAAEHLFMGQLTKGTSVIGEVPVPNATKESAACGAIDMIGRADLVKTSNGRIPGFFMSYQAGSTNPRPWYALKSEDMGCPAKEDWRLVPKAIRFQEQPFFDGAQRLGSIRDDTAPTWSKYEHYQSNFYQDVTNAPTSIAIGELKFGGTPAGRRKAKLQIARYAAGFKFVHSAYQAMRAQIDDGSELDRRPKPASLPAWSLSAPGELTSIPGTPTAWTALASGQPLVIAKWVEKLVVGRGEDKLEPQPCDVNKDFEGKLYGGQDSEKPHVWLYAWYPTAAPPENFAGSAQYTDYLKTAKRLIELGLATPGNGKKVQRLPLTARAHGPRVQRAPKPAKPLPAKDQFRENYEQWKEDRTALSKSFGSFEKTSQFGTDTLSILFNQALKNTKDITNSAPNSIEPSTSEALKGAEHGLRDLQLMAGPIGKVFGELRYRLGPVFIAILNAYAKVRDKLQDVFSPKDTGSSGGSLSARAFKVFIKILGSIASYLLPRVTDALLECVENGFISTLQSWIDDSPLGDLKERLEGLVAQANKLKEEVFADLEALATKILGPVLEAYKAHRATLETAAKIVDIAKKAFDVARAAACLAGGLETAGISCVISVADKLLSLVGASPSEHLLAWLLESCPAKEYFAKALLSYKHIKQIPEIIARKIVEFLKPELPEWLQAFVCNPDTITNIATVLPTFDEVACDAESPNVGRYNAPSGLDRSKVDRKPTDEEKRDHGGFDKEKWAGERPKPEPGEEPPESKKDETPPPASGAGAPEDDSGEQGEAGKFSIKRGSVAAPNSRALVVFIVHGIGRGFAVQKYEVPEERDVGISFVYGTKYYDSNDIMRVRVHEVVEYKSEYGNYMIRFSPVENYKLEIPGVSFLDVPKDGMRTGALGKRR